MSSPSSSASATAAPPPVRPPKPIWPKVLSFVAGFAAAILLIAIIDASRPTRHIITESVPKFPGLSASEVMIDLKVMNDFEVERTDYGYACWHSGYRTFVRLDGNQHELWRVHVTAFWDSTSVDHLAMARHLELVQKEIFPEGPSIFSDLADVLAPQHNKGSSHFRVGRVDGSLDWRCHVVLAGIRQVTVDYRPAWAEDPIPTNQIVPANREFDAAAPSS